MIYSKTCEYAIRSLIYFVFHPDRKIATVAEVSKESGVSPTYVAKIFQCLAQSRILKSRRGPAGGYSLSVPASELTILRIVKVLDDLSRSSFSNCIMGFDKCNEKKPCLLHPIWMKAKDQILEKLAHSTLLDVAAVGDRFRTGRQRRFTLSKRMREIFSVSA